MIFAIVSLSFGVSIQDVLVDSKSSLYLPPQKFFHLCAFLVMEEYDTAPFFTDAFMSHLLVFYCFRVISLDLLWQNLGPSESTLEELAIRASGCVRPESESPTLMKDSGSTTDPITETTTQHESLKDQQSSEPALTKTSDQSQDQDWILKSIKNKSMESVQEFLSFQPLGKLR